MNAWLAGGGIAALALACVALAWRAISASGDRARIAEAAARDIGAANDRAKDAELALESEQIAHGQVAEQLKQIGRAHV